MRSFKFETGSAEPGTVVLSNEANEKGPQLLSILAASLANSGLPLDQSLLQGRNVDRGGEPTVSTLQTLRLLQADALNIVERNGLSFEQAAQSAALATAFIVKECVPIVAVEVGFKIAAMGFVEGTKTVPPPVASSGSALNEKKPWYKLW